MGYSLITGFLPLSLSKYVTESENILPLVSLLRKREFKIEKEKFNAKFAVFEFKKP